MSDRPKLGADGVPSDGVGHDPATPTQLAEFNQASETLSRFRVPILVHANQPHERLFVALFDGTGNNKFTDPAHATNVAALDDQIKALNRDGNKQIYAKYLEGPGTQSDRLVAAWDSITGSSYADNIDKMYRDLVTQTNKWRRADPDVVVHLQTIGFSRGGSQAAGFARLVHERGIPDLSSRAFDLNGQMGYTRYHIPPGELVQTAGFFDPVATGAPMRFDRRLPPSVVSGFQITASNELRAAFPSDEIIPPGFSEDGRFLNLKLPGAHSDMAGGYLRDGLSIRCGNLMIDYCNAVRDEPFLQKRYEPQDPRLNVIHRSTEGNPIFRLDPRTGVRGEPSGTNTQLVPPDSPHAGPLPHRPEPVSPDLIAGATHRPVPIAPPIQTPDRPSYPRASPEAILEAGRSTPFAPKVGRSLGSAAMAVDIADTTAHTVGLLRQGNKTGSRSEVLHFASRNMTGWAGAEALALAG
ncbi:MAG TPA: DUF2235 domain-containing protein, partial [Dyella sp.]|uniref:phospholipase effector Tle1 domain-containing protein n=1 Tax=Dyella sp. TaxID=1869338 RepID=UPI002F92457C